MVLAALLVWFGVRAYQRSGYVTPASTSAAAAHVPSAQPAPEP